MAMIPLKKSVTDRAITLLSNIFFIMWTSELTREIKAVYFTGPEKEMR